MTVSTRTKHKAALLAAAAPFAVLLAGSVAAETRAAPQPMPAAQDSLPSNPQTSDAGASAQTPTSDQTSGSDIVVTGSRIVSPNLQSASPITTVTGDDLKLQGTTRVEDLINSLPQAFVAQSSGVSNGASGTATVNLRNFGTDRTLVLVNGRRLPPGDPSGGGSAADVNIVPAFMVKRVDLLTGGASATYGADAIAGVVNFVLDDDLQGLRIDAQGSVAQHKNDNGFVQNLVRTDPRFGSATNPINVPIGNSVNGGTYDLGFAFGTKFGDDRGHLTAYFGYHNQAAVLQSSRDYSSCPIANNTYEGGGSPPATKADDYYCSGSSNSAVANFLPNAGAGSRVIVTPGSSGRTGTAGLRAYNPATDAYNFNPQNYFQRPDERYTAGFSARYEISDALKPYANFMFMDDHSLAQIAPSGTFNNVFTINCNNSLATSAQLTALGCAAPNAASTQTVLTAIAKRNVEGGGRIDDLRHTAYRFVGGLRGQVATGLNYDAYFQYGVTNYNENYQRDFSRSRVQNAINGCVTSTGAAVSDATCVPYNIFTGTSTIQSSTAAGVTQGALDYISTPGFKSGSTRETVVGATFNADLGQYGVVSPLATDGITLAFGPEYRRESLTLNTDVEYSTGDLLGQGGQTKSTSGTYDVAEVFVEALVPLIQNKPLFNNLSFDGAYRRSHYSTVGNTDTYKLELSWSPLGGDWENAIRLRGSYNRAVRAPTVQDYFQPTQLSLGGSIDPCAVRSGGRASSQTLATCLRTAQTDPNFAAHFANGNGIARNPSSQYNTQTTGAAVAGSTLKPEIAITKTAGIVLEPRNLVPGLSMSVDWYSIKLRDRIGTDGYNTIMNQCLGTGSAYYCGLIKRDPANGSLWLTPNGYIVNPIYNAGRLETSGVDFAASYGRNILGAKTSLSFQGSLLLHNRTEVTLHNSDGSIGSNGLYDCKGFYGDNCGVPNPTWRHRLRLTVAPTAQYALSFGWRYIGPTNIDAANQDLDASGSPLIGYGQPVSDFKFSRIPAYNYFDISLNFYPTEKFKWTIGVNNIADKDPAIVPGADLGAGNNNGNTYPGYYDQLGRTFFTGVTLNF